MAKQIGNFFITGTIDNLCFYKMGGKYYVRMKSSLDRKRVKKSQAFVNTMKSANELGTASVLASQVYRKIPKEKRNVALYRKMTGMAKVLLAKGETKQKVTVFLLTYTGTVLNKKKSIRKVVVQPKLFTTIIVRKSRQNEGEIQLMRRPQCNTRITRRFFRGIYADQWQQKTGYRLHKP